MEVVIGLEGIQGGFGIYRLCCGRDGIRGIVEFVERLPCGCYGYTMWTPRGVMFHKPKIWASVKSLDAHLLFPEVVEHTNSLLLHPYQMHLQQSSS